jgi:CBS domain-containing protein
MMTVDDAMTRTVVSVRPELPLKDVARLLVGHGISGLPVVDQQNRVVGVVSEADLLVKETGPAAVEHRRLERIRGASRDTKTSLAKAHATTAGEAMTSPALTIDRRATLHAAATLMVGRGINRLPVTEDGVLVGIITRADLVRAFVRSDEELAETIRQEIVLGAMSLDPVLFDISVTGGIAKVRGRVDRRSDAELLERLIRTVPGIVSTDVDVSWVADGDQPDIPVIDHFVARRR